VEERMIGGGGKRREEEEEEEWREADETNGRGSRL